MTYQTKDSGQRQEYGSGMHRDAETGKPRFDLIMPEDLPYSEQMLTRWAELMERGALKYDARNWEHADSTTERDRFRGSAFRHFIQWYMGEDDEDHAAAVFFNVAAAEYVHARLTGRTEHDQDQGVITVTLDIHDDDLPARTFGFGLDAR